MDKKTGDVLLFRLHRRHGEMAAAVTATGMNTFFGKTAKLVETAQTRSHFQQAVLRIGNFLIYITLGLVAAILLSALCRADSLVETLLFCSILTVAAIPVALPAVMSVTMAVGAELLGAHEGDRHPSRRHRGDGGNGHIVRRQDGHADQERT